MKKRNIFSRFSLFIISIFASLTIHAQNTANVMDGVILMHGGTLQVQTLPDGKTIQKATLPQGAKLNEATLPDGSKVQELILSSGEKIQVYLNSNGSFIKKVDTSPDGTITTNTIEGGIEHMTIQSPNGTVMHATVKQVK